MSNGIEERIQALAPEWRFPKEIGPKTDPVEMFRMIDWYPALRHDLVRLRLQMVAKTYSSYAEINKTYAKAAEEVAGMLEGMK